MACPSIILRHAKLNSQFYGNNAMLNSGLLWCTAQSNGTETVSLKVSPLAKQPHDANYRNINECVVNAQVAEYFGFPASGLGSFVTLCTDLTLIAINRQRDNENSSTSPWNTREFIYNLIHLMYKWLSGHNFIISL